jgi:hypothetical protein
MRRDLSKYLSTPGIEEIVVHARYSYVDSLHMQTSNIDAEGMLKQDLARKIVEILMERDLIEFKTVNSTNPYEASVNVSAKIKVQPRYLKFKLDGMI